MAHTDLTNLTEAYIAIARMYHPAELSSKLHSSEELKFLSSQPTLIRIGGYTPTSAGEATRLCEIREICVKLNHLCEVILMRLP